MSTTAGPAPLLADLLLAGRRFQTISIEESVMSKVLAVMMAGLFAAGAFAQGTSQEAAPPTNTKPQQRAQERRADRPQGQVRPQAGDTANTAEGSGGLTQNRSTAAAQKRQSTRDDRRRAKDGSVRKMNPQGGTPQ
ncbi:cell envelope biogenesis protein TolA [Variovorax saccharolyticus]|uniref:cell envelope biogenesis protein TolA n=1 Tax=Variovorax saccharolyticus TaxID=3053516 RepID=UPI002574C4B4|nr:cell envelope biogenesis protein TolA [Variovorax sp. J22R187]MDM0016947.1 cell envelope biogenesis protein TolA [Variovorax sp. J22R187]